MRNKFVLIVGSILVALWSIGMVMITIGDAALDPFRLILSKSGIGVGRRIGTTTVAIVVATGMIPFLVLFVAFALKRTKSQLKKTSESGDSWLEAVRDRLGDLNQRTARKLRKPKSTSRRR